MAILMGFLKQNWFRISILLIGLIIASTLYQSWIVIPREQDDQKFRDQLIKDSTPTSLPQSTQINTQPPREDALIKIEKCKVLAQQQSEREAIAKSLEDIKTYVKPYESLGEYCNHYPDPNFCMESNLSIFKITLENDKEYLYAQHYTTCLSR